MVDTYARVFRHYQGQPRFSPEPLACPSAPCPPTFGSRTLDDRGYVLGISPLKHRDRHAVEANNVALSKAEKDVVEPPKNGNKSRPTTRRRGGRCCCCRILGFGEGRVTLLSPSEDQIIPSPPLCTAFAHPIGKRSDRRHANFGPRRRTNL